MSKPITNPPRLSSLREGEDSVGVGRMFREARELGDEELPRLHWRLRTSQHRRAMRPRLFLKVALVVGIAFFTGGVVGAVVSPFLSPILFRRKPVIVSPPPVVLASSGNARPRAVTIMSPEPATSPPEPVAEVDVPVLVPPPLPKPRTVPRLAVRGEATSTPAALPPVASAIAVEQTLLGQALRTLRGGQDARTALDLLAQHALRFPQGVFTAEATGLRIEALLALGRRDEALAVLDGAPLAVLPNQDEQRVVRGELRSAHRRWREAAQDFDEVLKERALPAASPKTRDLQERALWGRAAARSRLGDARGARADLGLYLRHFPGGKFVVPAASLLKGAP